MKIILNRLLAKFRPNFGGIRLISPVPVMVLLSGLALLLVACVSEANELNKAGVALENRNNLEESIVKFDEAILLDPKFALAYYNRAQANFGLGKFEAAKKDYDQAVSLDPESILFYTKRGNALLALGQSEQAIQDQNQAIKRDPEFALAYYNRGGANVVLGRRAEAIQDYKKAVSLDRRIIQNNNSSVRCALYDDLYEEDVAFKDCRGLSSHDPLFANAFGERGLEKFELGEYQQAIVDYDNAIFLSANRELYNNRGLAYKASGNIDLAFEDFRKATGRTTGFAPAYYNLGKLLYELGKYQFAAGDFSRAIQIDPMYKDAYADRALAYTLLGKDKVAELDIDRAVELGFNRVELEEAIRDLKKQR